MLKVWGYIFFYPYYIYIYNIYIIKIYNNQHNKFILKYSDIFLLLYKLFAHIIYIYM